MHVSSQQAAWFGAAFWSKMGEEYLFFLQRMHRFRGWHRFLSLVWNAHFGLSETVLKRQNYGKPSAGF